MSERIALGVMSLRTSSRRWLQPGALALWSLSALLASRLFPRLLLVSDARGCELLLHRLGLPFTRSLSALNHCVPGCENVWAEGKLWAYALAGEPFIHLDSDVLLLGPLPERMMTARFVAERPVHFAIHRSVWEGCGWLPAEWITALQRGESLQWGCGLCGGVDFAALREYAQLSLRVLSRNRDVLASRCGGLTSCWLEQWGMTRRFGMADVETLFAGQHQTTTEAAGANYLHLGGPTKTTAYWRQAVARRLEQEWPGQLALCEAVEADLLKGTELEAIW